VPWPHRSSRLAGGAAPRSGKRTERIGFSWGKLPFIWINRDDNEIIIGMITGKIIKIILGGIIGIIVVIIMG
jgi:hypothetical protein